jgi:hypothetical protein
MTSVAGRLFQSPSPIFGDDACEWQVRYVHDDVEHPV